MDSLLCVHTFVCVYVHMWVYVQIFICGSKYTCMCMCVETRKQLQMSFFRHNTPHFWDWVSHLPGVHQIGHVWAPRTHLSLSPQLWDYSMLCCASSLYELSGSNSEPHAWQSRHFTNWAIDQAPGLSTLLIQNEFHTLFRESFQSESVVLSYGS